MIVIMFMNRHLKELMEEKKYSSGQINAVIEMLNSRVGLSGRSWRNQAIYWLMDQEIVVLKGKHLFLNNKS